LGLDVSKFKRCVDNKTYFAQIGKDVLEGNEHHVPGTPQFYLGTLDSQESRMTVVTTIKGSQPYSAFKEALDAILGPEVQHTDPQPRVPAAELLETNVRESKDPVEHVSVPGKRR